MSKLKQLIATETTAWIDFPEIDGFELHLRYLTREDLTKIRNASLKYKINPKTRQREETIDNNKFLSSYAERAIIDWKGLKAKHLPKLLPVDISTMKPEELIEYTAEDAAQLLANSPIFDEFLTETMNDFELFLSEKDETNIKN